MCCHKQTLCTLFCSKNRWTCGLSNHDGMCGDGTGCDCVTQNMNKECVRYSCKRAYSPFTKRYFLLFPEDAIKYIFKPHCRTVDLCLLSGG